MTEDQNILQAYVGQFDRLQNTAADFGASVLRENCGMIFTATFVVFVDADFEVSAEASVRADGKLRDVSVCLYEHDGRDAKPRRVASLAVKPNGGLWNAMEIWLEAMRNTPESD